MATLTTTSTVLIFPLTFLYFHHLFHFTEDSFDLLEYFLGVLYISIG